MHRPTGHVLSERAVKEIPAAVEELLGGKWSREELLMVNPTGDDLDAARARLAAQLLTEREKKKDKKRKKAEQSEPKAVEAVAASSSGAAADQSVSHTTAGGASAGHHDAVAKAALEAAHPSKKAKALKHMSNSATKDVYASIFTSSRPTSEKETYLCRNTSGRGFAMS